MIVKEEKDQHVLFVTSDFGESPAGPRLFRGFPWPKIEFTHTDPAKAAVDAGKLQVYINEEWPKRVTKSKARAHG